MWNAVSSLSNHDEGRLSYPTGRCPRAVVVCYAVTDDQVVFLLPEYNEICQYAPGRQITMHVSALTTTTFTEDLADFAGSTRSAEPVLIRRTQPIRRVKTV